MKGEYPVAFAGGQFPPLNGSIPAGMSLDIDDSVVSAFLTALEDGRVTPKEARAIAELPANRQMLEHRINLGYVPPPLPTTGTLAEMIRMAGSQDPLDRLWCWVNPHNFFDYADIVQHRKAYARLLSEIETNKARMEGAVLSRIASYAPEGQTFHGRICLTVEPWIRGWATADTAGINLEFFKDNWKALLATMTHETYHRLQLQMCGTANDRPARTFEDLAAAGLDDARFDHLYEAVAYTALEGSASLVGGTGANSTPGEGARLMKDFVRRVVDEGDCGVADSLLSRGLKSNGPLYALGLYCAQLVSQNDGTRAVGKLLAAGPDKLILRALELDGRKQSPLIDGEVGTALWRLEGLIGQSRRRRKTAGGFAVHSRCGEF